MSSSATHYNMTQFTVIHLKDELCTLDSHIVYQFLKTNHNNLITLQPIFVSHDEEYREFDHNNRPTSEINRTTDDGQSSGVQDIPTDPAFSESKTDSDSDVNINHINGCCCICQTLPIFYTLLPCRHACVCKSCLKPLDKCPICRTYIDSYFRIGHQLQSEEGQSPNETVSLTRWQVLNQRVNEWLGFT
ncbi:CGRF1-like protein [Mya arenaria]|uniref:CGRF1-like protein n=1 Tax=Mya arenaria TaxID=6604 RepID=A0ABY7FFD4_MYAAR|nr:CGRF1-like protein [Mya arenaria]